MTVLREPYFIDKSMILPSAIESSIASFLMELIKHMRIQ